MAGPNVGAGRSLGTPALEELMIGRTSGKVCFVSGCACVEFALLRILAKIKVEMYFHREGIVMTVLDTKHRTNIKCNINCMTELFKNENLTKKWKKKGNSCIHV